MHRPKRAHRCLLPACLLLLLPIHLCWAQSLPLDEVMAELARAPAREARFTEEKQIAALTVPLQSQGRLAYRKPGHLEKITEAPQPESLVVDGGRLVINAGNEPPHVVELGSQPEIRTLVDTIRGALSGNLALLRQMYDVTGTGTPAQWRITLTPRDPAMARLVKEVRLTGAADLRTIESIQPNGDTDTLTITPTRTAGPPPEPTPSPAGKGPG